MKSFNCCFKKKKKNLSFFTLKKINIGLFLFLFVVSFAYILLVNNITVKGFELRDLRAQINDLNEENRSLETNLMSMKAYGNIYSQVEDLNMVAIADFDYINLSDFSVAKK